LENEAIIEVSKLSAAYGKIQVLWDCDLRLVKGKTLLIVGPNGAGKTTLLKCIAGQLLPMSGNILFMGRDITRASIAERAKSGIAFISENSFYPGLTVKENLYMSSLRSRADFKERLQNVYNFFPELRSLEREKASSLSGGQRKMLLMSRAVISEPSVLIIDEPSSGLSPLFTERVMGFISQLREKGLSMIIAEQNVEFLSLADNGLVMDHGRVVFSGTGEETRKSSFVGSAYFGM
jgi:branched-chain amino acid transport system ATP-binding protein